MLSAQTYVLALSVPFIACSVSVEGDDQASYGDVTLTVSHLDPAGSEVSRDQRSGPGDELVAPLDRELHDPIIVDGAEVRAPELLFAAARAEIRLPTGAVVSLTRADDRLLADGPSLFAVRSARRSGDTLTVEVEGGRFAIQLTGTLSPASADRFFATALVRLVRGEALLADDCRPDCIYSVNPVSWVCGPMRDTLKGAFGGECIGPLTPEAWTALVEQVRTQGKTDTCYDLWLIPRPICEFAYDFAAASVFEYLGPDAEGNVCAEDFYQACSGEVDACTAPE
jgi:hypothetical protein